VQSVRNFYRVYNRVYNTCLQYVIENIKNTCMQYAEGGGHGEDVPTVLIARVEKRARPATPVTSNAPMKVIQGYLAHKKPPLPRTLQ